MYLSPKQICMCIRTRVCVCAYTYCAVRRTHTRTHIYIHIFFKTHLSSVFSKQFFALRSILSRIASIPTGEGFKSPSNVGVRELRVYIYCFGEKY